MNNGGNGKPRNSKPLRILDLHGEPISLDTDGSVVKPRVVKRISTKYVKSDCCNMPMVIAIRSNGEIVTVCMRCKKYIGHMIPKPYAILYQGISGSILRAMKKKGCKIDLTIEELEQIVNDHLKFLVGKSEEFFDDLIDKLMSEAGGGDDNGEGGTGDESGGQADDSEGGSGVPESGSEDGSEMD